MKTSLFPRRPRARRFVETESFISQASCPEALFDIDCGPCLIQDCKPALRKAMCTAVRLANSAADKLEAASTTRRDGDAEQTARIFLSLFCHDPSLFIPWAGEASGLNIAKRLRAAARELGGGRRFFYKCPPTAKQCDTTTCCPDEFARARDGFLCKGFWEDSEIDAVPTVVARAGILIHEALHLLFPMIQDRFSPSRATAACYETFVLRVHGFPALRGTCKKCIKEIPCRHDACR
jgi:hypothetical protein